MAQEVFISHSSLDKTVADAVCAALENTGIRCWIAPRDVQPGRSFPGEITRAIQNSKVMVLIFSAHSNTSEQILREVQLAANSDLHILQFRIEDVIPNEDLEYYLSTPQRLDALTPPLESNLQRLVTSVQALLEMAAEDQTKRAMTPVAPSVDSKAERRQQDSVATAKEPTPPVKSAQRTTIPLYLETFVALSCKPETSLAERAVDTDEEFRRSLVFFAISTFLISPLAQGIGMPAGNFWTRLWTQLVFTVFAGLDLIGILALSFRLVGGRPKLRTLCITYFYDWGVVGVIYNLSSVAAAGMLRAFYPDTFVAVQAAYSRIQPVFLPEEERQRLFAMRGYTPYVCVAGIGFGLAVVWLFNAWGAFRRLVSLSKRRYAVAMVLFFILTVVGSIFFIQIVAAIKMGASN